MKLLLTSSGLKNKEISNALFELVGKEPKNTSLVFISTASNVEMGDKGWLIDDLLNFKKQGFKSIYITDMSAVGREIWLPQLKQSDVICFSGGNENYLADILEKNNAKKDFLELLQEKVYMGISAGSMVAGKFFDKEIINLLFPEEIYNGENKTPLGLVDLGFIPHLNSDYFKALRVDKLEKMKADLGDNVYACDDETSLKIIDNKIEVIGTGIFWTTK
ncbi:MAG: Type 1 glutamine amidotransferase-like domain-containing protein [Patescibacteria group bacterium]